MTNLILFTFIKSDKVFFIGSNMLNVCPRKFCLGYFSRALTLLPLIWKVVWHTQTHTHTHPLTHTHTFNTHEHTHPHTHTLTHTPTHTHSYTNTLTHSASCKMQFAAKKVNASSNLGEKQKSIGSKVARSPRLDKW